MSQQRKPLRIGWAVSGNQKWGWDVVIFDPEDHENARLLIAPDDAMVFSWPNTDAAREGAVAALRDLADRIEKGEP